MKTRGPWAPDAIEAFLEGCTVPLRLACNGRSGHPVLASLWFVPEGERLWCATQSSARVVTLLASDPRCAFEVAPDTPPYRGVRGQARAEIVPERGEEILRKLVARYLDEPEGAFAQWLLDRASSEVAIAISPDRIRSWDFTSRMRG